MKRNTVIAGIGLSVLLVALVFAAGCEDLGETACDAMSDKDRDHCIQKLAATSGNATRCDDIKGAGPASKCYALVAQSSDSLAACEVMTEKSWYNHRDAYHREDCLMYLARNTNSPNICDMIGSTYTGQATDLNPYRDVTQENCKMAIQCGQSGQPACRRYHEASTGHIDYYYCGEVRYPTSAICP
jgi:hypothetical protein